MSASRMQEIPADLLDPLGISVAVQGTTTTISVRGEWDLAGKRTMQDAIAHVLERSPERVVLDLSGLSFLDSSGVHSVLGLEKRSAEQNVRLVIVPGSRAVQRPFEVLGLIDSLPFVTEGPGIRAARSRTAHRRGTGSGGSLSPPSATPAAKLSSGRRR